MVVNGLDVIIDKGLQILRLNTPNARNAFNQEVYEAITDALNSSAQNDDILLTILTGTGDYFSSGTSLTAVSALDDYDEYVEKITDEVGHFISALIDYPKLLIAIVNGPAVGIAVTILGLCDIVLASDKATFQTPFMKLGLCPEACSSYTFPRIMGSAKAGQLLYLGYKMKADEACECGLVSNIFEHSKLDEILLETKNIAELPIKSLMCAKELIRCWDKEQLHKVRIKEGIILKERIKSDDFILAIMKFSNRRSKL